MIDDLLSPNRIEPLEPRLDDSDTAWREVTRRRRARTLRSQVVAGVALVAVVMVGLLPSLDDGGRVADLDVADRDSGTRTHLEPRADDKAEPDALGNPDPSDDRANSGARRPSSDSPGKSIEAAAQPVRPGEKAPTPGRAKPPVERTRYGAVPLGCIEWCLSSDVVKQSDGYVLALELCLPVGTRARRFSFPTTQEADFRVDTAGTPGDPVWTWSVGQQFPSDEHFVDVQSGECVRWATLWDATDEGGERLPKGSYRLHATSLAEQLRGTQAADRAFEISD